MSTGATGEQSLEPVVSQWHLGIVLSINSPFRLLLVKKGKLFPRSCRDLNRWALLCQVCAFLILQRLPAGLRRDPCWECSVHCVSSCLTGTLNLLLANGALHDLLVCFVLRLNSASHVLAKRSVQERRFLLKMIYFPRNFCMKANSCAFLGTYFLPIHYGTW